MRCCLGAILGIVRDRLWFVGRLTCCELLVVNGKLFGSIFFLVSWACGAFWCLVFEACITRDQRGKKVLEGAKGGDENSFDLAYLEPAYHLDVRTRFLFSLIPYFHAHCSPPSPLGPVRVSRP
jgi:hypothetical protein